MLKIYDNQIQNKEDIFKEICSLPYNFGETDNVDSKPTGLTTELSETTLTYKSIHAFAILHNSCPSSMRGTGL